MHPQNIESSPPPPRLTLSEDQQIAFDKIMFWLRGEVKPPVQEMSLGGYAGTGKTTLIKELMRRTDRNIHVMSLTGKAVSVLVKKGVNAQTIHSTIYHVHLEKKKPVFTLRGSIDGHPDILVVDEASMVSTALYDDLLTFGLPILWVGDHGQLEPIGANPGVMKNPIIKLEKIHRQAQGNPIIMFADGVRQGDIPAAMIGKGNEFIKQVKKSGIQSDVLVSADQIIVGINRTRVKINKIVREALEYPVDIPVVNDKMVCLRNNRKEGLFNGLQGVIVRIDTDPTWPVYNVIIKLDTDKLWSGKILKDQINKTKGLCEPDKALWAATFWDYAYAVTCHKSQGSEWPHVLVVEESAGPLWCMKRWRYTAITRASERLTYAC